MSISARNAVFLAEMGVGARWTLRHAQAPDPADIDAVAGDHEAAAVAPAAEAPARHGGQSAHGVQTYAADAPAAGQPAAMPVAPAATAGAPASPAAIAVAAADTVAASADSAASAPRPAPAAATAPLSDTESTAWFDDVPVASAPAPRQAPQPVSDAAIADMDWDSLQAAVASCTRCGLCATRRQAVNGRGPARAAWFAIAAAPSAADEDEARAITGAAGQLLDNMLKAIAVDPAGDAYITQLVKCLPRSEDGAERPATAEELTACRPFLERELALAGAQMIVTFGQHAARGLMMGPAARGKVMRYGAAALPVVATYHPDDLLQRPQDKAKAWADLCLARTARD